MADLYPESEKLAAIRDERSAIVDFCEWLADQGIQLCAIPESMHHTYMPINRSTDSLVYQMYEIDPNQLEKERRRMLEIARHG